MFGGRHGSWRGGNPQPTRGQRGWRGGMRRGGDPFHKSQPVLDLSTLGALISQISLEDPPISQEGGRAVIKHCHYVASYSLMELGQAKIVVPGQPPAWNPPERKAKLVGDKGQFYRDQNGAHFPRYPIEPTIQSLYAMNSVFDASDIDILGCASSLGDLLRFSRGVDATFRFDVEMVGDTVFFVRNHKKELIPDVLGYGHSFLNKFTIQPKHLAATSSHQRIIKYDFSGLKMLVRFECDGYYSDRNNEPEATPKAMFDKTYKAKGDSSTITVETKGHQVSQSSIFEIKTRVKAKQVDIADHLPRLWLRQIPNFIAGHHVFGTFDTEDIIESKVDLAEWESENKKDLELFASVLRQIIQEVQLASHLKLEICRSGKGSLQIRQQTGEERSALPLYWQQRWAGTGSSDSDFGSERNAGQVKVNSSTCDDGKYYTSGSDEEFSTSLFEGLDDAAHSDDGSDLDYTACSADDCGYCGRCSY